MSNTVHVQGISSQTSEKEVQDFFSFCGKIQSIQVTPESSDANASKSAVVTFEKETAAKTALLLDNTQLGPAQVHVTSSAAPGATTVGSTGGTTTAPAASTGAGSGKEEQGDNIAQEDKPRSRIVAEYLAHGYVISDKAIESAISLDQQHGVSNRFMSALTNFDNKYKVSEKAEEVNQKYGVSERAHQGWLGLSSYFEKAASTPTGQKLRAFYDSGSKQVMDVHNEAKHLASLKMGKPEGAVLNPTSADKNPNVPTPEQADMEKVEIDGKERTKCNCGGVDGKCPCAPGTCACANCDKNPATA